ncbi:hypothetical protein CK203_052008 [Vitis vinifera]|uniref:Uncharacterized protein n=1 Tax=Vitis vinifera TaxID=29760 RepID=A0A438FY03_VITVI|nr:hypothetical protein CK203_052008 [Vitis vinifera]
MAKLLFFSLSSSSSSSSLFHFHSHNQQPKNHATVSSCPTTTPQAIASRPHSSPQTHPNSLTGSSPISPSSTMASASSSHGGSMSGLSTARSWSLPLMLCWMMGVCCRQTLGMARCSQGFRRGTSRLRLRLRLFAPDACSGPIGGTQFGVTDPDVPLPSTITLANDGFSCPNPTKCSGFFSVNS